ncbi:hypothetical protein GCM10007858_02570 [Bradyrhizobium liaoningense]|nr:hypothetical protein GCM10007858_02570 [Bradyrhizobium liaoningense]
MKLWLSQLASENDLARRVANLTNCRDMAEYKQVLSENRSNSGAF